MSNNARALAVARMEEGFNKAEIAAEIGYSRAAVSRWMNEPDYPASKIEAAVIARYNRFTCPHLGSEITPLECAAYADRPVPTSNTWEVRHWKACQGCPRHLNREGVQP